MTDNERYRRQRSKQYSFYRIQGLLLLAMVVSVMYIGISYFNPGGFDVKFAKTKHAHATTKSGCRIKGNVSYNNNRKIYHVPGQQDYEKTRISSHRGERWFCSEADARANGWKKAGR